MHLYIPCMGFLTRHDTTPAQQLPPEEAAQSGWRQLRRPGTNPTREYICCRSYSVVTPPAVSRGNEADK
jgi:hypothetical protein